MLHVERNDFQVPCTLTQVSNLHPCFSKKKQWQYVYMYAIYRFTLCRFFWNCCDSFASRRVKKSEICGNLKCGSKKSNHTWTPKDKPRTALSRAHTSAETQQSHFVVIHRYQLHKLAWVFWYLTMSSSRPTNPEALVFVSISSWRWVSTFKHI